MTFGASKLRPSKKAPPVRGGAPRIYETLRSGRGTSRCILLSGASDWQQLCSLSSMGNRCECFVAHFPFRVMRPWFRDLIFRLSRLHSRVPVLRRKGPQIRPSGKRFLGNQQCHFLIVCGSQRSPRIRYPYSCRDTRRTSSAG